jgi:hypothetical protein
MTDAPERIWIDWKPGMAVTSGPLAAPPRQEYIRADLVPQWQEMDGLMDRIAAALWREEAVDTGTPQSLIQARTPEAFADQAPTTQAKWRKFARAAFAAPKPHRNY